MLTMGNTPGFTQKEIDEMNKEVDEIVDSEYIAYYHDLDDFVECTEAEVIKKHR